MTKKPRTRKTSDGVSILNRHFGNEDRQREEIDQIKEDMAIGAQIYAARTHAGLTQTQLARKVGTTQSVISDLEDAEYRGHTMTMLRRVADALGLEVEVRLTARN
jgi:ribosome-binding protein aMBF1 (putative translation factor)